MSSQEMINLLKAFEASATKTAGNLARIEAMTRQTASDIKTLKDKMSTKLGKVKVSVLHGNKELLLGEYNNQSEAKRARKAYRDIMAGNGTGKKIAATSIVKEVRRRVKVGLV